MASRDLAGVRIHVHNDGEPSLDGILRLIDMASAPRALGDVLTDMCAETAMIADVDIVSAYIVEHGPEGETLTMRGNYGFPAGTAGSVRLGLGEGITGFVAECLRPVTVAVAADDARFRYVPGIGEELFPAFLGVPVASGGTTLGVLVFQRRAKHRFTAREVTFATALSAPFVSAIERSQRSGPPVDGCRTVRLRGKTTVRGSSLGRACPVPTLSSLRTEDFDERPTRDVDDVLDQLVGDIGLIRMRLERRNRPVPASLAEAELVMSDARFRSHARDRVDELGLLAGLTRVARDYAKHDETGSLGRARDVEELCVLLCSRARRQRFLRVGNIVAAQRLGWPLAVIAAAERAGALLVEDQATPAARDIAAAAGIPMLERVGSLRTWTRDDDLVIVDADTGRIQVNPSATAVATFRRRRRLG